jgi:hypothetical protein
MEERILLDNGDAIENFYRHKIFSANLPRITAACKSIWVKHYPRKTTNASVILGLMASKPARSSRTKPISFLGTLRSLRPPIRIRFFYGIAFATSARILGSISASAFRFFAAGTGRHQ